jgi:exodeoxyribonuclease III
MKFISWNVNGLRAVHKKGFADWLKAESPDILCLQEVKISQENLDEDAALSPPEGYTSAWSFAKKPGYSGLGIYSRLKPSEVKNGLGIDKFDQEGRWLEASYSLPSGDLTLINSYFPNSQRDHARLGFKIEFCEAAEGRLQELRAAGHTVLLCGDFNIAHREIDLKNPKTNMQNAGFLPEERAWLDRMIDQKGWVDTFRHFEKGPGHYTWWSYRPGVREKNIGWRLDYFMLNPESIERLAHVDHLPGVLGSDHCPVRLILKN